MLLKNKIIYTAFILLLFPSLSYAGPHYLAGYEFNVDKQNHTFNTFFAGINGNIFDSFLLIGDTSFYNDSLGRKVGSLALSGVKRISAFLNIKAGIMGSSNFNSNYKSLVSNIGGSFNIMRNLYFNSRIYYYNDSFNYDFFRLYDSLYFYMPFNFGLEAGGMYYFTSTPNDYPALFAELDWYIREWAVYVRYLYYPLSNQTASAGYINLNTMNNLSIGIYVNY